MKRRAPKPTDNPQRLRWLRGLCCAVCGSAWQVEAHHLTMGRGLGQRTSDEDAIPLCRDDHASLHGFRGFFEGMTREERAAWQQATSDVYRRAWAERAA
jgi:hypothetical protein